MYYTQNGITQSCFIDSVDMLERLYFTLILLYLNFYTTCILRSNFCLAGSAYGVLHLAQLWYVLPVYLEALSISNSFDYLKHILFITCLRWQLDILLFNNSFYSNFISRWLRWGALIINKNQIYVCLVRVLVVKVNSSSYIGWSPHVGNPLSVL